MPTSAAAHRYRSIRLRSSAPVLGIPVGADAKLKALVRSLAAASRLPNGARFQRFSMNLKIEVVSYWVWSTNAFLEKGEMIIVGTRLPGPQRSTVGGATWSHWPPFSS